MEVMSLMTFLMDIPGNMTGLVGVWLEREKEKTAFTFPNCKELASIWEILEKNEKWNLNTGSFKCGQNRPWL